RRLILRATVGRALFETLLLYSLLAAGLWSFYDVLSQRLIMQGFLFVSLGCALYCAVRLRLSSPQERWRRDGSVFLILGAVFGLMMFAAIALDKPFTSREFALPLPGQLMLMGGSIASYGLARLSVMLWLLWDRLRRQRLLWSLTNAHVAVA